MLIQSSCNKDVETMTESEETIDQFVHKKLCSILISRNSTATITTINTAVMLYNAITQNCQLVK